MKKLIYIILALPFACFSQERLVMGNQQAVMYGGTSLAPACLVISDSNANAIVQGTGAILSGSEYNMVQWNIGRDTGEYTLPFGDTNGDYLPVTLKIKSNPGVGSGVVKFSTFHSPALNSTSLPSDVTNVTPLIMPGSPLNTDDSYNMADRFYIIDAKTGYSTVPAPDNITFSYVSGTANTEVGSSNTITESRLMAERFNSSANTWSDWFGYGCTDAVVSNIGTVQTGPVPATEMYRSWSLWDNTMSLPATIVSSESACNGASATVTIYGGSSPYTYLWSDASSQTTATATSLFTGTYTITVSDKKGCSSTTSVIIGVPDTLKLNAITEQNASSCSNNGSAVSNPTGGTSPYTYFWQGGSTLANINGLSGGTYTLTVIDSNHCTKTANVIITQAAALNAHAVLTQNSIPCTNNGIATANPTGGNSPYTYLWSDGLSQTTAGALGLSGGTYTVTVNDSNRCSATASVIITQPISTLVTVAFSTGVTCSGNNNGSVQTYPTGGTTPYTYSWSTVTTTNLVGSTKTVSGLSAGTYSVTVKDANGCTISSSVIVAQPAGLAATSNILENAACYGGKSGAAQIIATGGRAPYTYSWSNGNRTYSVGNLSAGTYTSTATDVCGDIATVSIIITQPAVALTQILSSRNVTCNGNNYGIASTIASGGVSPYKYLWLNGATTSSATGLSAGTYNVKVTDANTCAITKAFTITQPNLITPAIKSQSCAGVNNGSATISATGGTSPYTYRWSRGGTTATLSGLPNGSYTVTVTDKYNCAATIMVTLSCTAAPERKGVLNPDTNKDCCPMNEISVYPNPTNGRFTIAGLENGMLVEIFDYTGRKINAQFSINNSQLTIDLSNKSNGIYLIRILNADGTLVGQKKVVKTN